MKVESILNHVISHSLNHVWIPYDLLKISSQKMNFFSKDALNVW